MSKSYEVRLAEYKMKYQMVCENSEGAAFFATRAARWVFSGYPELREQGVA